MRKTCVLALLVCAIVGFDVYIALRYLAAQPSDESAVAEVHFPGEYYLELDDHMVPLDGLADGGEHFRPLRFAYDLPGIDEPEMLDADATDLADDAYVIGIEVDGQSYAFSMTTMDLETNHIVNFVRAQRPYSVTYCPLADCVRVLTRDESEIIPLRLGGLNDEDMMVFILDGKRYDQTSEALPLKDYVFKRTTFRDWRRQHPRTKVFVDQSIFARKISERG